MNEFQTNALSLLKTWFDKADKWQKDLFCQIWQGNEDVEKLIARGFNLAKAEYLGENSKYSPLTTFPSEVEFSSTSNCPVILKSISNVQGIGALAPTRSLEFGNNLTIVYGENGCGKSSYVRILKSAVSPKNSDAILNNVYEIDSPSPQASLTYSDDGNEHIINWKPNMKNLCPLNIYDSSIAKRFAEEKNEVIYEPQILSLLSTMTKVYEGVKAEFEKIESDNSSHQTVPEKSIVNHEALTKFLALKTVSAYDKYLTDIVWGEKEQFELNTLQEGLQNQDPSKQIKKLNAQKDIIEKQYQKLFDLIEKTGSSFSDKYLIQRKAQIESKREADILIEEIKKVAVLNETGSDAWRKMWSSAVKFANETTSEYNNTVMVNGKCVLCQQEVCDDTTKRIACFSEYMASSAINNSEKAHAAFQTTVEALQSVYSDINIEQIETVLRLSDLSDEIINPILLQYRTIILRCKWLLNYNDNTQTAIPELLDIKTLQESKNKVISDYVAQIKSLQEIISDRDKQIARVNDLLSMKWILENKNVRRKDILIKAGISECKTNSLTTLKKELTQILITNTYITRFENEMRVMDCNHKIKVELVSKAEKGKAYHQVALKGAVQKKKTRDVLSEGEFRVVSLAAFLADLSSWNKILPFIFDDPITSLDHKYEKKVADRLVKLSIGRQVIVFTHRLAFAQLLVSSVDEYNKSQYESTQPEIIQLKQIELRDKPLGEPSEPTYHGALKMKNALNDLKNRDISLLKKQYKNGEYELYDKGIKSLCSEFRMIVEQGIETDLLSKIVTRFGYSVNTLRLKYLYIVTQSDIDMFNDMMTKYSAYEHSQSTERPVELPALSEIEEDVDSFINWCKDFGKRCDAVDKKK